MPQHPVLPTLTRRRLGGAALGTAAPLAIAGRAAAARRPNPVRRTPS